MPKILIRKAYRPAVVLIAVAVLHVGGLMALQSNWLVASKKIVPMVIHMQIVNQIVEPVLLPASPPIALPATPSVRQRVLPEPARPTQFAEPIQAPLAATAAAAVATARQPQATPIATAAVNAPTALPSSAPSAAAVPAAAQSNALPQEPNVSTLNSAAISPRTGSTIVEPIIESSYSTDSSRFKRSRISETLRESGIVSLTVTVASDGSVKKVVLKRSSGYPRLDAIALREAKLTAFKPATMNGSPIERDYQWDIVYDEIN
jgi:periplasmic protein TonB